MAVPAYVFFKALVQHFYHGTLFGLTPRFKLGKIVLAYLAFILGIFIIAVYFSHQA